MNNHSPKTFQDNVFFVESAELTDDELEQLENRQADDSWDSSDDSKSSYAIETTLRFIVSGKKFMVIVKGDCWENIHFVDDDHFLVRFTK